MGGLLTLSWRKILYNNFSANLNLMVFPCDRGAVKIQSLPPNEHQIKSVTFFFSPFFCLSQKACPQNGEAGPAFEASMSWHWFNWFRYDVSFLHFSKNSQVLCSGISYFPPADAVFRVTDLKLFRKAGTALDLCEFVLTIGYWKGFPMLHPTAIGNTSRAKALLRAKIIHQFLIEFLQCPSDLSFLERE